MDVVGAFIVFEGKILLLKRQKNKPQGNTWGIPGGKVELGETHKEAIIREIYEETTLRIIPQDIEYKEVFHVYHDTEITYYAFLVSLEKYENIQIDNSTHTEYRYLTPQEALKRSDLIADLDTCIKKVFNL